MNARNSAPDGDAVGGVVRGVFVTTHMLTFFVVLLLLLLYWRGSGAPVAPEKKKLDYQWKLRWSQRRPQHNKTATTQTPPPPSLL